MTKDRPLDPSISHILDLLAPLGPPHAKRMFGGWGIYLDRLMVGLVIEDVLYLKADDSNRAAYLEAGLPPFLYQRSTGKTVSVSYYRAPDAALEAADDMRPWAEAAFAAARRAAANAKPRRRPGDRPLPGGRSRRV